MSTMNGWLEARVTVPAGGWPIDCNDGGGAYTITIPAGTYTYSADDSAGVTSPFVPGLVAEFNKKQSDASKGMTMAIGADGLVTVHSTAGTPTITWDAASAAFEALTGFSVNVTSQDQVSDIWPTAIWEPDCALAGYNASDATVDDWRGEMLVTAPTTESRLGDVRTLMYQKRFVRSFEWPMVSAARAWIKSEATTNESWERFYRNVVLQEQTWATSVVAWNHDKSTGHTGLYMYRVTNTQEVGSVQEQWTGRFSVRLPRLMLLPAFNESGVW